MPEAVQLDATDVASLADEPCGGEHEELFESEDGRTLRVLRRRFDGHLQLETSRACQRVLLVLEGAGAQVDHGQDGPPARLKSLTPYRVDGGWKTAIKGQVGLMELLVDDAFEGVETTATRLGLRTLRDALVHGAAFVYAHAGSMVARITDEEEPFELGAGESLWLDQLDGDEELELTGTSAELVAVLVHLRRGDDRR